MISFLLLPKGSLNGWITSDQGYFGKKTVKIRNIDWLSGVWFAALKTKEALGFMTLRSRRKPSLVNSF
jgi:hypothetical protein